MGSLKNKERPKAKDLREVRNYLLVHPDKHKDKPFLMSYSWGKNGPVFKNVRLKGDSFELVDRGLWVNANEFKCDFEEVMNKVLDQ